MYLKQVAIHGFKSFADKIEFSFLEGINAVVGPNGSGKSNISDAIRWVLGEQSAKSLRAGKMEDVIFSGTEKRKQLGFAEVSLYIDNTDKRIPVDFSEINIMRRMFRSGESEYFINKVPCRMKDVHELFMDTGIGREGYSIIGQGRIDEILSNKSEDRRQIFEEAAGIVKYRMRKEAAERKLEHTKQNIVRIQDIICEIEGQLAPLKEQAETARKYRRILEELKVMEVNLFLATIDRCRSRIEVSQKSLLELDSQLEAKHALLTQMEINQSTMKEQIRQAEIELSFRNEKIHEKKTQRQSLASAAELELEKKKGMEENIRLYHQQITENSEEATVMEQTITKQTAEIVLLEDILKTQKLALEETEKRYYEKYQALYDMEMKSKEKQQQIMNLVDVLMEHKSRLSAAETFIDNIVKRKSELRDESEVLSEKLAERHTDLSQLSEDTERFLQEMRQTEEAMKKLHLQKGVFSETISELTQEIQRMKNTIGFTESRLKVLQELEQEHSGYNKTIKAMLENVKGMRSIAPGFQGVLGDLISVPDAYVTAVETALGGAVQNVVTETEQDAKNLIDYLKKHKLGRATFYPISVMQPRNMGDRERAQLKMEGFVGIASELIHCNVKYKGIIANLLGRVIIADTIDHAIEMANRTSHNFKIVTLEGEVLNPGGSMSGGSRGGNSLSVLSRKNEISRLKVSMAVSNEELEEKCAALETERVNALELEQQLEAQTKLAQSFQIEYNNMINQKDNLGKEIEQLKQRVTAIRSEIVVLESDETSSQEERKVHKQKIFDTEKWKHALEKELTKLQEEIVLQKNKNTEDNRKIMEQKTEIASSEQKKIALEHSQEILIKNVEDTNRKKVKSHMEIEMLQKEIVACETRLVDATAEIKRLEQEIEQEVNALIEWETLGTELRKKQEEEDGKTKLLQRDAMELQDTRYKEEMQKSKLELELENQEEKLLESYDLSYGRAVELRDETISLTQANRRSGELKESIREMGAVNVNAVEEYDKLVERYAFMQKQVKDLIEGKESISQIIQEMLQTMKKQFITEFYRINVSFEDVFVELFGGGSAKLVIEDETNVLESGIEIIARPPGKKQQTLSLLSGGERALTAIALLFGILKLKPAPFCVLDEIDAALDDANVDRYANYLRRFAETMQFIVITHRKGTMESANSLYGISMQDSGISKMLSVKLENKYKRAVNDN